MTARPLRQVPTGIPGLDAVLDGGLFEAGLTIVQGQPGTGKTILGNQMCFSHAANGGQALYVTLLAENHARMVQHVGPMGFFDPGAVPGKVAYVSAFPVLDAGGLRALLRLLWEEVRRRETTLLVLDGLVSVELQADGEVAFKKFVHELQNQASLAACGMVLLTSSSGDTLPITAEHTMVDAVVELRSRLYGWRAERDLEVVKRRGAGFLHGRHAFRITDQGLQVFPRFEALLVPGSGGDAPAPQRIPTGSAELDGLLGRGIPAGSSTLVSGCSGAGKTTLALQFLGAGGAEAPGLMISGSESPAALHAKAVALGLPAAHMLASGQVGVLWSPGASELLDELAGQVLQDVERRGVRRLVIDGTASLARLAPDPARIPHVLSALRIGMRDRGVTTLLTSEHPGERGGPQGGQYPYGLPLDHSDLSGAVENVVALRVRRRRGMQVHTIQVRKARDAAIDSRVRTFTIGAGGLGISPTPDGAER